MNRSAIEALIQEKLKKASSTDSFTNAYVPIWRTTLIEPVPETHDMAKLVAETRAKMKQEEAASPYLTSSFIQSLNQTQVHFDPPDVQFGLPGRPVAAEIKIPSASTEEKAVEKTKSSPGATKSAESVNLPERAPGAKLHSLAKLLLTTEAYRRYVEPHLADMYLEYNAALSAGDVKAAKRVVWRGYFEVVKPFAYGLLRSLFRFWLQSHR
jgi:hypothetical protein